MSETPLPPATGVDGLIEALVGFTGCIGTAFDDICSYSLTIGDSYVPFLPDDEDECEDGDEMCSQIWVRVTDVTPRNVSDSFEGGDGCFAGMDFGLEVGVVRCIEVEANGEAPTATQVLEAAVQSMEDMNRIYCAAMGCEVFDALNAGQWQPFGPEGGQYGGFWTFTAERD